MDMPLLGKALNDPTVLASFSFFWVREAESFRKGLGEDDQSMMGILESARVIKWIKWKLDMFAKSSRILFP